MLRGQPVIHTEHHRIGAISNIAAQPVVLFHAAHGKSATVKKQNGGSHSRRIGRAVTTHQNLAAVVHRDLVIHHHGETNRRHIQQRDHLPVGSPGLLNRA